MSRVRTWYLILLCAWAFLLLPGYIMGLLMSGGDFTTAFQTRGEILVTYLLNFLFVLPLVLLPIGIKKK